MTAPPPTDPERSRPVAPDWWPAVAQARAAGIAAAIAPLGPFALAARIEALIAANAAIHDRACLNLNPATNVMNPAAERALSRGLGPRASLGAPGDKYETGLEAIEEIEVIAMRLACAVFRARHAEVRVPSGAIANLMAFMACCRPGDAVIVPPAAIGGHVTHHTAGAAGLFGLTVHEAPVDAAGFSVDVGSVARIAEAVRPSLITVGGSLNLLPHPVAALAEVARRTGARLLFDAAHLSGPIAGGAWPNPLAEGADLMTMSTYKSLGGPPGGLIVTDDAELARRLDAIAFPGLTANHDSGRVAALALTLADWQAEGAAYAAAMVATARALAAELFRAGLDVYLVDEVATRSHQFALDARSLGGGQTAARQLRRANLLACGIGLPLPEVPGDLQGLRIGTPEIVRLGMSPGDMAELAGLIARGLGPAPEAVAPEVTAFRGRFGGVHYTL